MKKRLFSKTILVKVATLLLVLSLALGSIGCLPQLDTVVGAMRHPFNWGTVLSSDALVLSDDTPARVKTAAKLAKYVFGSRIQICTGTNDQVEIQAAIDALPTNTRWESLAEAVADDGGTKTAEAVAANNLATNDMTLLPAIPAVNDAYYFGGYVRSDKLQVNIGTQGVGIWTITWEYWNGAWTALSDVTDGTSGFTAAVGEHDVTFTMPSDWVETIVEGTDAGSYRAYWVRARVSAYTSITTQPKGTQAQIEVDAGGGVVKLSEGNYAISNKIELPSNIHICGSGKGTILKIPDGTNIDFGIFQNKDTAGGNYNIVVSDMLLDANSWNQSTNIEQSAIYFNRVDWSVIRDLEILNGGEVAAIRLNDHFNNSKILNNVVKNGRNDNCDTHYCSHNIIKGNHFLNSGDAGIDFYYESHENTIVGNVSSGNLGSGISIGDNSNYNTVMGNTCSRNRYGGINITRITAGHTCEGNVISGNTCNENGTSGIYVGLDATNNVVTGNTCTANSQLADATHSNIRLYSASYNLVTGNICRKGGLTNKPAYGISVDNAPCSYNVLHGNDLYDSGSTGDINDVGTGTLKRDNRALAGDAWIADV